MSFTIAAIKANDEVKKQFAAAASAMFKEGGEDCRREAYTYRKIGELNMLLAVLNNDDYVVPIIEYVNAYVDKQEGKTIAVSTIATTEIESTGVQKEETPAKKEEAIKAKAVLRTHLIKAGKLKESEEVPATEEAYSQKEPIQDEVDAALEDEFFKPN